MEGVGERFVQNVIYIFSCFPCLGKKDFKDEIHVMAAALSKEIETMENQVNRAKDAASEAFALREEGNSLRALVAKKVCL
jgi:hypothetical protein